MGESIGLLELFKILKKRWYIIILFAVIGLGMGYGVTEYIIVPEYSSSTKLLVSRPQRGNQLLDLGEIQSNIQMINTYRDVIQDAVVLNKVSSEIGGALTEAELLKRIDVLIQDDSQIFGIQVTDTSPERAAEIANLVAVTFRDNIGDIINVENVAILSPAVVNRQPISPNLLFNLVISTFAGMLTGAIISLTWYMLDTKVHDDSVIRDELDWINLGSVTSMDKAQTSVKEKFDKQPESKLATREFSNSESHQSIL